jgi:radical SAM protein with 4Fe4S-binding SPASM domain
MISVANLRKHLSEKYALKCFVDLAHISAAPGNAYKQCQECYQVEFDNNDRLVFYTTDSITDELLGHLYQAARQIDISNFFVLICSPTDISAQLKNVAQLISMDLDPFQALQINFEKTTKLQNNYFVPDTICPMPWMHLEVSTQGNVQPCCVYNQTIGNVRDSSLNEIFYNNKLTELRQEFLAGAKPLGCNHCWKLENKGLISNRSYHMRSLKTELLTTLDQPKIRSLDLKPGNTCNFKCRICSPTASSLFAQEASKFQKIPTREYNWAEDDSKTIDEIKTLLPDLLNLDLYGGEPFLIKELAKLVKQAVELGHANNIQLHYNSNGSIYPANLIEYWKKFRHVDIHFSIDNIGARFELERGGTWSQVESNIKNLLNLNLSNLKISVMPAISIMNIFYIDELLEWADSLNLPVNPLYVSWPGGFALKNLTAEAKSLIVNKFKDHPWPEMKNILNFITSLPDSDGLEFLKICKHFDSIRNQNFAESHPEIAKSMGYVYNNNL